MIRKQLLVTSAVVALAAPPVWAQATTSVGTEPIANAGSTDNAVGDVSGDRSVAQAETAMPEGAASGDIVVTARRRAENISKVPIAITALSGESLIQNQIISEVDLQRSVPGLTVRTSSSTNQFNFALRGQSVDTYSGSPPAVLSYINEAQIVQHSAGTFYDLDGIQVLKGPQGTLFGRNSTGGAVLLQTAKPTDELSGYALGRLGNYKQRYLEGAVSLPFGEGAGLRVAGVYNGGGAYVRNLLTGDRLGKRENKSLRGTLVLNPTAELTNSTVVQHSWEGGNNVPIMLYSAYRCGTPASNTTADCAYGPFNPGFNAFIASRPRLQPYAGGVATFADIQRDLGPWKAATEVPTDHEAKSTFVINTTAFEIAPEMTIKNIVSLNRSRSDDLIDYDGTPYPIFTTGGTLSADGTTMTNTSGFVQRTKQFSNELQLQGRAFNDRLTYVIGGYFLNQSYDILSNLHAFDGIAPPTNFAYEATQKSRSRALFAQGTYELTDQLNFTAGYRHSWETQKQTTGNRSAYFPFFGRSPQKLKGDKPSWTFSLDYQATPELLLYITQRGSWRTGGFNYSTVPVSANAAAGGNIFNPETSRDVEIGLKYSGRGMGVPVTFTIAAYQQWVKNVQRAAYVPGFTGPGLVTANVPKARIRGVETDLSVRPTDWLTLGGSLAYTDPEFTDNTVTLFDPVARAPFNTFYGPFADTPKWTGSVFFDATHELAGDAGKLVLHADVFKQSKFTFSNVAATLAPGTFIKGYTLANARLGWNNLMGTPLSAAFFARNIFNKRYYTGGNSIGPTLGLNTSISGQPRMLGGELRVAF
jgi:iron complex outermembrane recepter protein